MTKCKPAGPPALSRAEFSAKLMAWRDKHGLNQTDAAASVGVHLQTWSAWEVGSRGCRVAGLVVDYLRLRDAEKEGKT